MHRLSEIDETSMTATCAECGSVPVKRRTGKGGGWRCSVKMQEQKRRQRERNPWSGYEPGHGLTLDEAREFVRSRGSRCEICGHSDAPAPRQRLVVDHDHATGKIRGALCRKCNLAIAHLKDSAETAQAAADYLRRVA